MGSEGSTPQIYGAEKLLDRSVRKLQEMDVIVARLLERAMDECNEVSDIHKCIQILAIIKKGIEDLGTHELIHTLFNCSPL